MSFVSGVGSFPGNAAPAYGTPVYPSTLIAQQWNPFNSSNRQQPGPGGVSTAVSINTEHSGSWKSEVPVEGQLRLVPGAPDWTRFIEAGDQLFFVAPHKNSPHVYRLQRNQMVAGFNLFTVNEWLRDFHNKALSDLMKGKMGAFEFDKGEQSQKNAIRDHIRNSANSGNAERLRYLTAATICEAITYIGANNTQSNELKSLDASKGSISATHGEPMVVFGARGPHRMRNVWGKKAVPGRHLWLILRRHHQWVSTAVDANQLEAVDGELQESVQRASILLALNRPFQFVPYVADMVSADIPDDERNYHGLGMEDVGGEQQSSPLASNATVRIEEKFYKPIIERGRAFYVGMVLSTGRSTHADSEPLNVACGLATPNDRRDGIESDPPSKITAYEQSQALETIMVQVNPQAFGSFVILA